MSFKISRFFKTLTTDITSFIRDGIGVEFFFTRDMMKSFKMFTQLTLTFKQFIA